MLSIYEENVSFLDNETPNYTSFLILGLSVFDQYTRTPVRPHTRTHTTSWNLASNGKDFQNISRL
jgi:hypothetical protein